MTTTEINYKGTDYTCRIVTSNEGESLIIGGLELLDALMPYPITTALSFKISSHSRQMCCFIARAVRTERDFNL